MHENPTFDKVPELSLRAFLQGDVTERAAFQADLFAGLKYFGFIVLRDHPVSRELLASAYELSAAFFARTESEKQQYSRPDGQRGYTPFGREHAKDASTPDLKEFWHVGREFTEGSALAALYPANNWPDYPERFRTTFLVIFSALEEAGLLLLDALAPSLDVSPDYFRHMATDGNSILRLLHYPPIAVDVAPGAIRAAAHEDINLITILPAAEGAGLQLLDRHGVWMPIETDPDNLIVDAGDMLARITNDLIPATTHRVVNPTGSNVSRYSMPFFMHPRADALLTCLDSCKGAGAKYPPLTADAFLKQRLQEIGLGG